MTTSASGTMTDSPLRGTATVRLGWASIACIAGLFVWFHSEFLWRTILFAYNDKNWSHAFLVPLISGYLVFLNRHRLSLAPIDAISPGARRLWLRLSLGLIVLGLPAIAVGLWGGLALMGMVILAGGAMVSGIGLLLLLGWLMVRPGMVRLVWGPLTSRLGLTTRPEDWLRVVGLGVMIAALVGHVLALYPIQNHMARGYSMIAGLFGLCLFLFGPRAMYVLWLPIAYLVFAVKVSDRLWQQIAQQLQDIAAVGSSIALKCFSALMSFDVASSGNQITLSFMRAGQWVSEPINIAEACSGLRMLMAFIALGTALAFIWERRWWQRVIIIGSTVPIAVLINIGRVTVIGLLYLYDKGLAQGETHVFVGMLMLIPAAALLLGVGWVLDRIIVEEPDGAQSGKPAAQSQAQAQPGWSLPQVAASLDQFVRQSRGWQAQASWPQKALAVLAGLSPAGRGLLIGMGLMLLAGAAYTLVLVTFRPDLAGGWLAPNIAAGLLLVSIVLVIVGTIAVPRLMPRASGSGPPHRLTSIGVVVSVLLVAGLGQQGVLGMTKAVLFKQALPLRKPLALVPDTIGPWQAAGEDVMLPPAQEEALGTQRYLIRRYVDQDWPANKPGGQARVHVAYYSGKISTVPHVPDRCFVAGGLKPLNTQALSLSLGGDDYTRRDGQLFAPSRLLAGSDRYPGPVRIPAGEIPATVFKFAHGGAETNDSNASNVLYFFAANGTFMASPEDVRIEGWDLRDKYAYYAKIEVSWPGVSDTKLARKRTETLLGALMPEIMACLPDWHAVQNGEYPAKPGDDAGPRTALKDGP
jgi:exosortase